jgi:Ca-activated chloride channel family protein
VSFGWPVALLGLVAVPVLLALYVAHERRRGAVAARFGSPPLLPNVLDRAPGPLRHLPIAILLVGLVVMIVGVARPHATVSVRREEATVIIAVDTSRSMRATDVKPSRLVAARSSAKNFLDEVPAKFRVGVVSFATRAVVGVAPTQDRSLVEASLASLSPGEGTAIGDAVALSLRVGRGQRASGGSAPPRAIVVISDGARDGGRVDPAVAAQQAKAQGVPVYTVLVGTANGVVQDTLTGGFRRIIRVPASPDTLQQIAETSGGQFFAAPDQDRLRQVYEDLGSRLGKRRVSREMTDAFAGAAAVLLLVGGVASAFLFRRVP